MKEVIIQGRGKDWDKCTYDKETWIIAKMLMYPDPPKRVDMAWWMDDLDHSTSIQRGLFTKEEFVKQINKTRATFMSCRKYPEIPLSQEFPLKAAMWKFRIPYLSNTICYMIAYALLMGYKRIDLWGTSFNAKAEYIIERAAVEYWLGLAVGMGVEVNIKTPSMLLKHQDGYIYGYNESIKQLKEKGVI
ncbi:MAG: hypothetical protein ACTSQE_15930 [Candidatus Heimdallarchaeaceae archaeon]